MKLGVAVLVSGRGSNLQALIDASSACISPYEIVVVISDREDALALERAKKANIAHYFLNPADYLNKEEYEKAILQIIGEYNCGLIALAGFMRILSPYFIHNSKSKIINIHPSLLPAFPGLNAQQQALEYGVKYSGCTVHFVDEGIDSGPIILQAVVPVKAKDTIESLSARILVEEHRLYPQAIAQISKKMNKS